MPFEHDCLKSDDFAAILAKLDEMAADGWEIASSHCAVDARSPITHFVLLKRETAPKIAEERPRTRFLSWVGS
jgi:hypothetical protein